MPRFDKLSPDSSLAPHTGGPAPILRRLSLLGAVLLLSLLFLPVSARADNQDVAKGKKLYIDSSCPSCHGDNGREPLLPEYPIIAGQSAKYVYLALGAYKAHNRMGHSAGAHIEIFKTLTVADLHLLADYIATLK